MNNLVIRTPFVTYGHETQIQFFHTMAGLKLKASKCKWFQRSVQYLGHIVSSKGIECDPEKIATIRHWPTPRTVTQVHSFLSLVSYYRKFIENFSEIAHPLINLTRKRAKFHWTDQAQQAVEALKECLVTAPVLTYPMRKGGDFILDTEASNHGMGKRKSLPIRVGLLEKLSYITARLK